MIFWRYGSSFSKASQVLGDFSRSQRAINLKGPAVIFTSLTVSMLLSVRLLAGRHFNGLPAWSDELADRVGDDPAVAEDRGPAHDRADDFSAERKAHIRAYLVPIEEVLGSQDEVQIEIDEGEIRVGPYLETTLPGEPEAIRHVPRGERGDLLERHTARVLALIEHHVQKGLATGDAAPRPEEVAAGLHVRGAGRMIRGDERDVVFEDPLPELLEILVRAQRRGALRARAELLNVLLGQDEVVSARLAGDVDAFGARDRDEGDAPPRADVHDVQRASGLLGEEDRPPDRLQLGGHRARVEIVAHRRASFRHGAAGEPARDLVVLRVDEDREPEFRRPLHTLEKCQVVGDLKVLYAAVGHERLEPHHAALRKLVEAPDVAGDKSAPQTEVHERRSFGGGELEVEAFGVEGGRVRVERHLHVGGHASGRQRPGARGEALPVGAARLVEVRVGVNGAREDVELRSVYLFLGAALELGGDVRDPAVSDGEVGLGWAVGRNEGTAPQDHVVGAHALTSRDASDSRPDRSPSARSARKRPITSIAAPTSSFVTDSAGL